MRKNSTGKMIALTLGLAILGFAFFLPLYTGAFTNSDFTRCDGCHIQAADDFSRSAYHKSIKCSSCHNVTDFAPDLYSHNVTTAECSWCHNETNATRFEDDAHSNLQNASFNSSIFAGRNEMCVACHTAIDLEVEWHTYTAMNITVSSHNWGWKMQFSVSGDNKSVNLTNYTDYLNNTNWSNRTSNP